MGRWIIQHDDYRSVIRLECKNRKISFRSICAVAHIHTSYFSRVMSGDANLSEEQLFKVGEVLGFRDWPLEYFLLLGARDRSGAKDHRSYLGHKIEEMRAKYSKVISKLDDVYTAFSDQDIGLYYQNSLTACIHMYLTIPKFASNPSLIAKRLRISEEVVAHELGLLAELGIISSSEHGEVKLLKHAVHLDEHHPASNGNHKNWRILISTVTPVILLITICPLFSAVMKPLRSELKKPLRRPSFRFNLW